MEKINFENLKPPAISKETLMALQDNIQQAILEKDIMTAYQTSAQIANQNQTCNLQSYEQVGSNLSFSNNGIVIGERVKSIAVKGRIFFEYLPALAYARPLIKKNDEVIARRLCDFDSGSNYFTVDVDYAPVSVQQGDKITLNFGDINNLQPTTRGDKLETFLTVEVLEYTD